jgi:hypothetical protein
VQDHQRSHCPVEEPDRETPDSDSGARRADTHPIRIRTKNLLRLLVEGAARMEGLSLGLVHGRPPLVGCVRRIALTCGFTSAVRSWTWVRTATDQKFTKAIGHPTGAAGSVIVVRRVAPLRRTPRTPSSRITPLHRAPGHRKTFPGDTLYWQAAHWRPLS